MENLITTEEAGTRLHLSRRMVQRYILQGRLPAERIGRAWVVRPADLKSLANRPGRGRPRENGERRKS